MGSVLLCLFAVCLYVTPLLPRSWSTHLNSPKKFATRCRSHGFAMSQTCPILLKNQKKNAMMKSLLLTPVTCPGPERCHHVGRWFPMLGFDPESNAHQLQQSINEAAKKNSKFTPKNICRRAWETHFCKMRILAE